MIALRPADERGATRADWLTSRHTFSFGDFHDAAHMGFGSLRVINEDVVAGGTGFPPHSHANMEILSFVLSGRLAHRDNQGGGAVLQAGDVQWMSAGHGIRHSEFNGDTTEPVHFLQVWIQPDVLNAPPTYLDRHFARERRQDRWCLVAAPAGEDSDALPIRQDARIWLADLSKGQALDYSLDPARRAWLQVVSGSCALGELALSTGDGVAVSAESTLRLRADAGSAATSSVILFDLP